MEKIGRLITAMATPFDENGAVNFKKAEELVGHLISTGSDGIVVHGTTGESPTLTHEEEYEMYKTVKKASGGKATVIAGTGSNSTETTVRSTRRAEEIGCDAALLVVPYYNKPSQEGLYRHFRCVADNSSIPLILYNIPGRTGINMAPETIARLSQIKNFIGVKDAAGDVNQTSSIRMLCREDFIIWSGDDSLTLPMMSVGGYGVISVASHIAGREIKAMIEAFASGDAKKAQALHIKLMPLFKVLFITSNPAPLKYALSLMGIDCGVPRLPLVEPLEKEKELVSEVMKELKII